ncbi:hypothetical protein F3Y22_tig00113124pilonHSYRG00067 [Hibiscus syriacus]|uniref:Uncharacterized protein n=1 Tax=Hibiscus syriacus TaxID=106335 RepID=A0A6A2Y3G3_HIBSY|nr:hypothetical protein F3Y22_tig00113124pilonHSYRG00067 [Hibiscus syriacus]
MRLRTTLASRTSLAGAPISNHKTFNNFASFFSFWVERIGDEMPLNGNLTISILPSQPPLLLSDSPIAKGLFSSASHLHLLLLLLLGFICNSSKFWRGMRTAEMKLPPHFATFSFLFLCFIPEAIADLDSDKQALLRFSATVPHGRKLNWSPSIPHNNFSGRIASSLSPNLDFLDLSFNSIAVTIPTTVQNLTNLTGLDLQNNSLIGYIPNLNLPRLRLLNLSFNNLNGTIPSSINKFPASL